MPIAASNKLSPLNNRAMSATEDQPHHEILLDRHLLTQKATVVEQFLKAEDHSDALASYPHPQLQELARSQMQNGQMEIRRSAGWAYFGESSNEAQHGYGLLICLSEPTRFYEGQFQNGCRHGRGLEYIGGDVYIGKFLNDKPEDNSAVFLWANGDSYIGGFLGGLKHGQGTWRAGEDYYAGSWKFNRPEGIGEIQSALSRYTGDVRGGHKHGIGRQLFANGDSYEGSYANGKPQGQGIYRWANGSIYKGQFRNGLRHGQGEWQFGNEKYIGSYVNDKRSGQGEYYWAAGSHYHGAFLDDLRHGYGEMHWAPDSKYAGQWAEGMQNGPGQIWEEGRLVEKGIYERGKLKINSMLRGQAEPEPPLPLPRETPHREPVPREPPPTQQRRSVPQKREKPASSMPSVNIPPKKKAELPKKKEHVNHNHRYSGSNHLPKTNASQAVPAKKEEKDRSFRKSQAPIRLRGRQSQRKRPPVNISVEGVNDLMGIGPIKWRNFGHLSRS